MYAVGMSPTPEAQRVVRAQVTKVKRAMDPWAARYMYLNFAETCRPTDTLWTASALERLRAVKATVDPNDLICANHAIAPAD